MVDAARTTLERGVEVKVILDRIKVTQCSSAGGITVSSVVYVEGVALPRSGNFYVLSTAAKAWHVALSNTPRLCAVPRTVRRSPSPSRQQASGGIGSVNYTPGSASLSPVE